MSTQHTDRPETFEALTDMVSTAMTEGAASSKHGFHTPTLISIDADGSPDGRTVVLREANLDAMTLVCHTDSRAPKLDQLRLMPSTCWVLYDADTRLQVRAFGTTTVHTDDAVADERWLASTLSSRRCYLAPHTPGQPADHASGNLPESLQNRAPVQSESEAGRQNFAVVRTMISRLDALVLHRAGHVRAAFGIERNPTTHIATWLGEWLEP